MNIDIYNLPKSQKKICRQLIDMALQRECTEFIDRLSRAVTNAKGNDKTPLENYHQLFKLMHKFDKTIADTYDNLGGSRYFMTLVSLYMRGVLTDNDISVLDQELHDYINLIRNIGDNSKS